MKQFVSGLAVLMVIGAASAGENSAYLLPQAPPPGLTKIHDNLARKYPLGLYNRMAENPLNGSDSASLYPVLAYAAAFTPETNRLVKRIQIPVHIISGTNAVTVGLYSDNAGVPGTALKLWHLHGLSPEGTCCALTVAKSGAGIAVTGGLPYWVVVKTAPGSDFNGAWSFNTTDQVSFLLIAVYCEDRPGIACSSSPPGQWKASLSSPGLAFAVYGE